MSVAATGATAVRLAQQLQQHGVSQVTLLLGHDAAPAPQSIETQRYTSRQDLDEAIQRWLQQYPGGIIVSSAAINDYEFDYLAIAEEAAPSASRASWTRLKPEEKAPSGSSGLAVYLKPAAKLIDQLPAGHTGPLVAFKYQDAETVRSAARRLQERVGAALVVVNSLCGEVQELLDGNGRSTKYNGRAQLEQALRDEIPCVSHGSDGALLS